ncbi:FHA domain-containing protein [Cellulomonas shaoxiangyii]|uniref:FHA domain-containing protein n=1 Tax=Cellulomonas shaoxiangyii TaxID=2566013 RepID=A0A4P7SNH2_9CELL|nr:FHA domain-containing protein [Cellulomonas shaoxiangyii]
MPAQPALAAPGALPLPPQHPAPAATVPATPPRAGVDAALPVPDPLATVAEPPAADVPTTLGAPRLPATDDAEADAERTVVRPRAVRWRLRLDDGRVVPLERPLVVIGRRPPETDGTTQVVALPDTTRTLSKTHARLELRDGTWWVTDLGSTNGVVVADADGAQRLLPRGEPARVPARVRLGDVGMVLEQRTGRAR